MDYLEDKHKNKVYLCVNYPFSNYDHLFYNNSGTDAAFTDNNNVEYNATQARIKHNIYDFVKSYTDENRSIDNIAAVDLTKGVVRLPFGYRQGINYNYMIICKSGNSTYDRKTNYYYCFIDDIEWSSNGNTCVIHFHIDAWNTYAPRLNFKQSYIEREHVNNDTYGTHIIDEGLSPSNFIVRSSIRKNIGNMEPVLALGSTNRIYANGVGENRRTPDALYPSDNYGYNPILLAPGLDGATEITLGDTVDTLTKAGIADAIIGVYLMPTLTGTVTRTLYVVTDPEWQPGSGTIPEYGKVKQFFTSSGAEEDISVSLPSVSVRNNKTLTYPYCFLNVSNQLGNELSLKFENSNTKGTITVTTKYDTNINGAVYLNSKNYDGISGLNFDYSIQTMNYPTLPYIVDSYDSYLASNKNMLANARNYIDNDYNFNMKQGALEADATQTMSQINNLMSVTGATAAGGGAAAGPGGILRAFTDLYTQGTAAQLKINAFDYNKKKASDSISASLSDKAVVPDKFCGRYAPNNLMANNNPGFILKVMTALPEELDAIDKYFSRYGYKINTFKVPEFYYRTNYDFKKIIDINFTGEIPNNEINIIKSIFNNGVTMWHNKNTIFSFDSSSTPNSIR